MRQPVAAYRARPLKLARYSWTMLAAPVLILASSLEFPMLDGHHVGMALH